MRASGRRALASYDGFELDSAARYLSFGCDESGSFPTVGPDRAEDGRVMVISVAASRKKGDGRLFRRRGAVGRYLEKRKNDPPELVLWTELNGPHTGQAYLRDNPMLTRQAAVGYLLKAAGFYGTDGQRAYVDAFWNKPRHDDTFSEALQYFGINPGTVTAMNHADDSVPVVRIADRRAHSLWSDSETRQNSQRLKIEIPPGELLRCLYSIG